MSDDTCVSVTFEDGTTRLYPNAVEICTTETGQLELRSKLNWVVASFADGKWRSAELVDSSAEEKVRNGPHISLDHEELKTLTEHLLSDATSELYKIFKRTWK